MDQSAKIFTKIARLEAAVDKLSLRQEAMIAAIGKLASIVDTTNALISEMAMWAAAAPKPPVG